MQRNHRQEAPPAFNGLPAPAPPAHDAAMSSKDMRDAERASGRGARSATPVIVGAIVLLLAAGIGLAWGFHARRSAFEERERADQEALRQGLARLRQDFDEGGRYAQVAAALDAVAATPPAPDPTRVAEFEALLQSALDLADRRPVLAAKLQAQDGEAEADPESRRRAESQRARLERIDRITADGDQPATIGGLRRYLLDTRVIENETLRKASGEWESVGRLLGGELRERYPDLELKPQFGLLPRGVDERTGLLAFAHLISGNPPPRPGEAGEADEKSGLLLLLIPAGEVSIDGKLRPVAAFFAATSEPTKAQLRRRAGTGPTAVEPTDAAWLSSLGLRLPDAGEVARMVEVLGLGADEASRRPLRERQR